MSNAADHPITYEENGHTYTLIETDSGSGFYFRLVRDEAGDYFSYNFQTGAYEPCDPDTVERPPYCDPMRFLHDDDEETWDALGLSDPDDPDGDSPESYYD